METTALTMFSQTVKYEKQFIWVKPVCDYFNLDVRNQHKKIKNDPILAKLVGKNTPDLQKNENLVGKNSTDLHDNENLWIKKSNDLGQIDKNGRILLTKKGFVRWINIINSNTIEEKLREKFIQFQELIFDYLYGSAEDEETTKFYYNRLMKLERLYGRIGIEIKQQKALLAQCLNSKFNPQYAIEFTNQQQINS